MVIRTGHAQNYEYINTALRILLSGHCLELLLLRWPLPVSKATHMHMLSSSRGSLTWHYAVCGDGTHGDGCEHRLEKNTQKERKVQLISWHSHSKLIKKNNNARMPHQYNNTTKLPTKIWFWFYKMMQWVMICVIWSWFSVVWLFSNIIIFWDCVTNDKKRLSYWDYRVALNGKNKQTFWFMRNWFLWFGSVKWIIQNGSQK